MRIQKKAAFIILTGIFITVILVGIVLYLVLNRRKQDTTLKVMYKRLLKARDANDIYNSFNSIIKHCFGINLKASSQSSVMSCLPDSAIASQVIDIMNYMESAEAHSETDAACLKKKIKSVYYRVGS